MPANVECAVCGDKGDGQHFGADACRACAAFFRRTVAGKMKYVCRFENNCAINKTLRCMCRSCRLTKCLEVGMNPSAVQASRAPLMPPQVATTPSGGRQPSSASTSSTSSTTSSIVMPVKKLSGIKREHQQQQQQQQNLHRDTTVIQPTQKFSRYSMESTSDSTADLSPTDYNNKIEGGSTTSIDDEDEYVPNGNYMNPKEDLQKIIENAVSSYTIVQETLPPNYPVLMTMVIAYQDFVQRRNQFFQRTDEEFAQFAEQGSRTFVQKNVFNIYEFAQNNRTEVEWIAAMLSNFPGYCNLPINDKVILFKHFWIHFVILERTFDTFCVLDDPIDINRMVLQNGDVFEINSMEYDCSGICEASEMAVKSVCHPWIKLAGNTMLNPMKDLRPVDIEMMFAFGFMFWNIKDVSNKLSASTINMASQMTSILYSELSAYYSIEMRHDNFVRRIAELMRLIGLTEKIVSHRKEDIMLSSMFNVFKIDVFLNELFEFVHT
uniref:Nuclear receptor n=1 Tax=Panagrolaimus superbus TaxID=310955 RepID=A0A914YXC7_9BILA